MSRLLILACSQRKRPDRVLLPAIERYDGPAFRVLRRYLRTHPKAPLTVYILSAKFGLIDQRELIPNYDQRMTAVRAKELVTQVAPAIEQVLRTESFTQLLLCVGRRYLVAMAGYEAFIPQGGITRVSGGALGSHLSELHDWLHGAPPERFRSPAPAESGNVHIRGVRVTMTPPEVLDVARRGLAHAAPEVVRSHSWCVPVLDGWVAPKWLVGQLTGLPVSAFTTDEARRVLAHLGVEVQRR